MTSGCRLSLLPEALQRVRECARARARRYWLTIYLMNVCVVAS